MTIGLLGLGRMGSRIAKKLLEDGNSVFVWNRSAEPVQSLMTEIEADESLYHRLTPTQTIHELVAALENPRVIWCMVPAGEPTNEVLLELEKYVSKGDIVIDGGNAYYKDTQRRFDYFKKKEIRYLGVGVSGGIFGYEKGFSLMIGGDKVAFDLCEPVFATLSRPAADFTYLGEGGAGHFAKMVHNAIEYGMMQSIAEGFGILEKSEYPFNLLQVAKIYQKGTIISSFLIDRTVDALSKDEKLQTISGVVAETGETRWAIETAKKENVEHEIIEQSLEFRKKSQKNKKIQNSFAAKLLAVLRHEFGNHAVTPKNYR